MDSQLLTLSKIFTERLFRIPDYQRGYAWGEKQIKEFWTDIIQLEPGTNHYTGVLTLKKVPQSIYQTWEEDNWIIQSRNYEPYFVVDGQQRLTTSIILLQVLLETTSEGVKLNYTDKIDVQRKFIFDSRDSEISRSYIFGYERDNPSYNFLKSGIFGEWVTERAEETVYTQNLLKCKNFFTEAISALSFPEIEALYRKVTQNLLFNIFTISSEIDEFVAFETMNNRGKPLSHLERLKNRLIYLSLKFDEPEYERSTLRKAINDCWRAVYHSLGKNKMRPLDDDRFLLAHHLTYYGKGLADEIADGATTEFLVRRRFSVYADTLLDDIFVTRNIYEGAPEDSRVTLRSIYGYVSSLQESVETWFDILSPDDSGFSPHVKSWLDKINRLGADPYLPMILVVMMQKSLTDVQRVSFLKAVERSLFITYFFAPYLRVSLGAYIDMTTIKLATDLKNGKANVEKVIRYLNDSSDTNTKQERLRATSIKFRNSGFYEWPLTRYFLFEYNLSLQSQSKTSRAKIIWSDFVEDTEDNTSIEHIYPQKATDPYWTERFASYSPAQRQALRNSLGNLLPLSRAKNASLSNRPFPEKAFGKTGSVVSYRYGSYAENEVAANRDWTPSHISERGLKLLNFMETRWDIKLGTEDEKLVILGLRSHNASKRQKPSRS